MRNSLFPKLAAQNIRKNIKYFLPFILSASGTAAMFYVMSAIKFNEGVTKMRGADYLAPVLGMGCAVIAIFALIFLLYTNSFLMKRRKKELGLYSVLGMEKRHISLVMLYENLYVFLISTISGLLTGVLFDKLVTLFLCKLMHFEIALGFHISKVGLVLTASLFAAIFLISYITNVVRVRKSDPVELLRGGNVGEKEPKTKWVTAVLGVVFLAFGYTIAITVDSPLSAMTLFFIAVLSVIAGTYCLFIAGSIAILKALKKNKKYYYTAKHFNSVSGMIYRMKQNAVGLANICILSTMVLVMVSTTVSLYAGAEDALKTRYPSDIAVNHGYTPEQRDVNDDILSCVKDTVRQQGLKIGDLKYYEYLSFAALKIDNGFSLDNNSFSYTSSSVQELCIITADEYERLSGKSVSLGGDEVAVFCSGDQLSGSFELLNKTYTVKQVLESFPVIDEFASFLRNINYIVVQDETELYRIYEGESKSYGDDASDISFKIELNLDAAEESITACAGAIGDDVSGLLDKAGYHHARIDCRNTERDGFYAMYGSFLFLGIVLGTLFLMVTVMIIYYKQISEGYDDKRRFEIMQQVGMSREEVKKSIGNQVLTVFFLPLLTAFIHLAFAFPIIKKLMVLLNLTNVSVFAIGLAVTAVVFAAIYAAVYAVTARSYYRIVC